jgi:hypothetical protein
MKYWLTAKNGIGSGEIQGTVLALAGETEESNQKIR